MPGGAAKLSSAWQRVSGASSFYLMGGGELKKFDGTGNLKISSKKNVLQSISELFLGGGHRRTSAPLHKVIN